MTTRPVALGAVTAWQLRELGFRPAPVLVRPDNVAYEETIGFKVGALQTLRQALDESVLRDAQLEYVDDYGAVVDAINGLGQEGLAATHFDPQTSWQEIATRYTSTEA